MKYHFQFAIIITSLPSKDVENELIKHDKDILFEKTENEYYRVIISDYVTVNGFNKIYHVLRPLLPDFPFFK